jgi:hypothetical protein
MTDNVEGTDHDGTPRQKRKINETVGTQLPVSEGRENPTRDAEVRFSSVL